MEVTGNLAVWIRKVGNVGSRSCDGVAKAIVDVASPKAGREQAERQYHTRDERLAVISIFPLFFQDSRSSWVFPVQFGSCFLYVRVDPSGAVLDGFRLG